MQTTDWDDTNLAAVNLFFDWDERFCIYVCAGCGIRYCRFKNKIHAYEHLLIHRQEMSDAD